MEPVTNQAQADSSSHSPNPRATRYEPCRNDACLTWKESSLGLESEAIDPESSSEPEDPRQFALLLDISQTGASIALDRVPRPNEGVWLGLEGGRRTDWTEARVVGVTTTTRGPHLVRLAFRNPCPFETLVAAICD